MPRWTPTQYFIVSGKDLLERFLVPKHIWMQHCVQQQKTMWSELAKSSHFYKSIKSQSSVFDMMLLMIYSWNMGRKELNFFAAISKKFWTKFKKKSWTKHNFWRPSYLLCQKYWRVILQSLFFYANNNLKFLNLKS